MAKRLFPDVVDVHDGAHIQFHIEGATEFVLLATVAMFILSGGVHPDRLEFTFLVVLPLHGKRDEIGFPESILAIAFELAFLDPAYSSLSLKTIPLIRSISYKIS